MPAEWEDEFGHDSGFEDKGRRVKSKPPLRPPLYNAEDYTRALSSFFSYKLQYMPKDKSKDNTSAHAKDYRGEKTKDNSLHNYHKNTEHLNMSLKRDKGVPETPPEMSMRKFSSGSELLFKLGADLEHAYPSFVSEFISSHCEGVSCLMETLRVIQSGLDGGHGGRGDSRKLLVDEQKCLQCIKLCLRNIEAVARLITYPGGLYHIASTMVSTVTATRIIALEILTSVCSEGGSEGHFKVCEAISTLRLRMGEPIRCKLLIGALNSAAPGLFQAKGIKFLTAWVSSAPTPKQKVHIQLELEEAGFSTELLKKGAVLGGAREALEVQSEINCWERVSIDIDTLTRQNSQLRNSVATLQQELATLKDKLKRMDVSKNDPALRPKNSKKHKVEEASTPADSEEEAEQIHQILEDLNNIVNSNSTPHSPDSVIIPMHLVKSPPPKQGLNLGQKTTRPWPHSSASDDDDSDLVTNSPSPKTTKNVKKAIEKIEKNHKFGPKNDEACEEEPQPDYLPNFHKQNHMASKFANFKSSKLSSSPHKMSNMSDNEMSKNPNKIANPALRRSESLQTSLASFSFNESRNFEKLSEKSGKREKVKKTKKELSSESRNVANFNLSNDWKSMESLEKDNFTLKWKYPEPAAHKSSPKSKGSGVFELFSDYRQNRFSNSTKNSSKKDKLGKFSSSEQNGIRSNNPSPIGAPISLNLFSRIGRKNEDENKNNFDNSNNVVEKNQESKMFSLPPIFMSQGKESNLNNHRISDLPSGLY